VAFLSGESDRLCQLFLGGRTVLKHHAEPPKSFRVRSRTMRWLVVLKASRQFVGLIQNLLHTPGHSHHLRY